MAYRDALLLLPNPAGNFAPELNHFGPHQPFVIAAANGGFEVSKSTELGFGTEAWLGKVEKFNWASESANFVQSARHKKFGICFGYCGGCEHSVPNGFSFHRLV